MRGIGASVFLLALAAAASAQDQQLGARTKAMGGSYTAFEDDPVSVWLNPAGIAPQPDQVSIAYQTYTGFPVTQDPGPGSTILYSVKPKMVLADPEIIPSYLGVVFQVGSADDPMSIGICYARPYLLNYALSQISSASQTTFQPDNQVQEALSRFRIAFAKDFRFRKTGDSGFLTHLSVGAGLDVGYERWSFRTPTGDTSDTEAAFGGGFGLLLGVYDDYDSIKINFGFAYQSGIHYDFSIDPSIKPAFDMPSQVNIGTTLYLLKGFPLRATFDVQFIQWKGTAEAPQFSTQPGFEDVVNFSAGFEYRIKVSEKVALYPRLGYRRFDAPWADKDNLPSTGSYKLVLDTKAEKFNIITFGAGISWTSETGKVRSLDIAADVGGDVPNVAVGYTHEF